MKYTFLFFCAAIISCTQPKKEICPEARECIDQCVTDAIKMGFDTAPYLAVESGINTEVDCETQKVEAMIDCNNILLAQMEGGR